MQLKGITLNILSQLINPLSKISQKSNTRTSKIFSHTVDEDLVPNKILEISMHR